MNDAEEFDRVRAEICGSGPPSSGDNLLGMEIDCCAYLGDPSYADDDPGLWHDMNVRRDKGGEWLIRGHAKGDRESASAIGAELARIWDQHLRYHFRSERVVNTSPDAVVLKAVTQIGPGDIWVTATVEVTLDPATA